MRDAPSPSRLRFGSIRIGLLAALFAALALQPLAFSPSAQAQDRPVAQIDADPGIQLLRSMVEANPEDRSYRIRLAGALFDEGRYAESAEYYAAYIDGRQASPQIIRNYLFALTQMEGGLEAGERTAEEYSRIYPTDAEIQMRLGYFRLWQGRYASAHEACRRAGLLDPDNEQISTCVEQAANPPSVSRGSTQIARLSNELREAGTDFPRADDLRYQLADAFAKAGRFQEAWDQLLILEPRHGRTARWLDAFLIVEAGLSAPDGSSTMYPPDRYTFLLRARPDDRDLRIRLVDILIDESRFRDALTVLTAPGRLNVQSNDYSERIRRIVDLREAHARQRIAALTGPSAEPMRADDLAELASHYTTLGRGREAVETCDRLAARVGSDNPNDTNPADTGASVFCMRMFAGLGHMDRALRLAERLERTAAPSDTVRRQILITRLESGRSDPAVEREVEGMLSATGTPTDPDVLLAAAGFTLGQGKVDRARMLVDRLPPPGAANVDASRRESLQILIEREQIRADIEQTNELLRRAQSDAAAGRYEDAQNAYERYFEQRGARTRSELRDLARVHASAAEYEEALSILRALEEHFHDPDVTKQIARVRMDMQDPGGALAALDRLIAERPRDWEARLWRADVLSGLGYHADALEIYDSVPEGTEETFAVAERRALALGRARGAGDVGDWSGLDYAGILAPGADGVRARGGGTAYDRWAQGMQTHVTTPIGLVVLAGVDSHFLSGTRRLVPDSETVAGRINRIWTGGIFDFTPQIASDRASYTSRLTFEGGLFDYEGGRTMPFGAVRYWRQEPGVYDGSIGVRTTEGSIDLWSPAGGQYDLRLTQINVKGTTTALAADSTIRVAANVSLNLITDNLGSTLEGERNTGSNIRLEAAYRVANDTYLGVEYLGIDFRSTVDIYWSPQNYSQYDVFLEYEGEAPLRWYLRLRAAIGMVARSDGFVTRRLEADWIRRLDDNFSISLRTGLSASARSMGSSASSVLDRYNSASFGAALYWTL